MSKANILFVSLGCDKNLCDSEHMLGDLAFNGYTIVDCEEDADIAIVNTCSFIADALTESIDTIIELGQYKDAGIIKGIIITGCMAQRFYDQVREQLPEVDAVLGTNSYEDIVKAVECVLNGQTFSSKKDLKGICKDSHRLLTTGGHYAYLKIAEGCDKYCTYCVIPYIRGSYRSISIDKLVKEATKLAEDGVKELILVAQETTIYGTDLYGKNRYVDLLRELCQIEGVEWIRLLYCYPEEITDELIDFMASEPKICHYIDMPIQHCNDRILSLMGRKTNKSELLERISYIRSKIPDICIRTTLLSSFPSETEEEHKELLEFVETTKLNRLGCFAYSPEEGTRAFEMDGQLEDEIKKQRVDEIMSLQKTISLENNKEKVGRVYKTFIEGSIPEEGVFVGRTYMDAPGVDSFVFIESDYELNSGDFVDVRITGFDEYDLMGHVI